MLHSRKLRVNPFAFLISTLLLAVLGCSTPAGKPGPVLAQPRLLEARRIWDAAPHNAFTDLVWHRGEWLCVFREGTSHVSPDGAVQVIGSRDGNVWRSVARLVSTQGDLRDPKITLAPDGQLMLIAALAYPAGAPHHHQSLVWFSKDGRHWGEPIRAGDADVWLWRVAWHSKVAYGIGYDTKAEEFVRLYRSPDGRRFTPLVPRLFDVNRPNESGIVFEPDGTMLCLLRRDGTPGNGLLGRSRPPYVDWTWQDVGARIGGPQIIRLPDGRLLAAVRLYDGKVRTALAWVDRDTGRLTECLSLPSGRDTSYPGLVLRDGVLWVSYYASHEGKTSIYLAKVSLKN